MTLNFLDFVNELESNFARNDIRTLQDLEKLLPKGPLAGWTIQNIDLTCVDLTQTDVTGAFFLGCTFASNAQKVDVIERGAIVFPKMLGLPFNPYRNTLYTTHELLDGWEDGGYQATKDFEIYEHFNDFSDDSMRAPVHLELAQRMHDHAIDEALDNFIEKYQGEGVVGIMGGHNAPRTSQHYYDVAHITWHLTRAGYLIASGGGPGIMEAANLGAYLASYANVEVVAEAISMLKGIPNFSHARSDSINAYIESAMEVVKRFRSPNAADSSKYQFQEEVERRSLAVPTWFYGHEPTNLFSNHVAKYFANSIREDGLLAICSAGVIYAPGGAGTLQEVFIDLSQNHYAMGHKRSPMCFLGEEAFGTVYQLIQSFIKQRDMVSVYGDMIKVVETAQDAVDFIKQTPARVAPR